MKRSFRRAIQGAAITSVVALTGSFALISAATPSTAAAGFAFTRIAGPDRFTTAADLATAGFPGGSATALIATGFNFPDALAGNYLAGQDNAPILLVNATGAVPAPTLSALQTLKTSKVIILGGTSAVGADVATELAGTASTASGGGNLTVSRVSGAARDDTAEAVNTAPGAAAVGSFQGKKTAFLARDDTFPDALGAGPVAFAEHFPIILTPPTVLAPQASATLSALGIQQVLILGGTAAIATSVEQAANAAGAATLARFAGANRSDTSKQLADYAITNFGFKNSKFAVASGDGAFGGADALAAGPFAAKTDPIPLLVTNSVTDPGSDVAFGTEHSSTEAAGIAVGGTTPLPDATLAQITAGVTGTTSAGAYSVTPAAQQVLDISGGAKNVTYSVTGIPAGTNVDVYLYACNNVTVTSGAATFNNSSNPGGSGNAGVPGATGTAVINQVNGTSVGSAAFVQNVQPASNGTLTFQVTDSGPDCVTPVVFSDAAANNVLALGTNNQPTIPYGVGGSAVFEHQAPSGTIAGPTITAFTASTITANGLTYNYSPTATFQIMTGGTCTASTSAAFQAALSIGDILDGTYNPTGTSTFCLNDIAPAPPTGVAAAPNAGSGGGVTVTFTGPGTGSTAGAHIKGFNVYRAAATPNGASFLCPSLAGNAPGTSPQTPPAAPYTLLGTAPTVTATAATAYTYNDTTAMPATPAVAFCYTVASLDVSGQVGTGSAVAGPAIPSAAVSGPPAFSSATGASATKTIVLTYNQPVLCASVDTDGSDFTVTTGATSGPPQTADVVTAAACTGTSSTTVTLTMTTLTSGNVATVTAKAGTDTNTVGSAATPETFQLVGNSIISSAIV